jgi:hypothetical protein
LDDASCLNFVEVDLEFELVLNVLPEHAQKILRVHFFIQVAILVQICILHQGLTSMDLGFVVLSFHENP